MLTKFIVENYKNFCDPLTMDFIDTHDYMFNNHCVKNGLLNKVIIYGANSSGKSNLGFALFDIVSMLTDKNVNFLMQKNKESFINADSDKIDASFTYYFKKDNDIIKYAYRKSSPSTIIYEELSINDEIVYTYDFVLGKHNFANLELIGAQNLNFEYFDKNIAILRYIANNTIQKEDSYVKYIMNFVSNMLWFRCSKANDYIGLTNETVVLDEWIAKNNLVNEFQTFLYKLAGTETNLESAEICFPRTTELLVEKHKNISFVFSDIASSGSKSLELLFYWSKQLNNVSFLFIDDFDAYYHFDLAKNVVKHINKFDNLQAIFTTHNTILASNELLRPDCYFTLRKGKLTSFVNSTSRELREYHNLEKMLRNGEFN